jgi:hypothetical protein
VKRIVINSRVIKQTRRNEIEPQPLRAGGPDGSRSPSRSILEKICYQE